MQVCRHFLSHFLVVAGEYYRLAYPSLAHGLDSLGSMWLHDITQHDVPHIVTVTCHVNDGARGMAMAALHALFLHQFLVAHAHLLTVNNGSDAVAADFLNVAYAAVVNSLAIGTLQTLADRVGRGALCQRSQFHEAAFLLLVGLVGIVDIVHCGHVKDTERQRACLVEHYGLHFCQGLQHVGSLHQYSLAAGTSDACEERERYADNQSAGTTDDEEYQCAVYPLAPHRLTAHENQPHYRREQCQRQSRDAHRRGVDACKTRDEVLRA